MAKWLTKSNFNAYLVHPAKLWLAKYEPEKLPPWDDAAEAMAVQGREIETIARKRWPDGLLLEPPAIFDAPDITIAAVKQGVDILFEAAVLTNRKLFAAADVVVKQPDGSWDLYEIKSSTKVKPEHYGDVAFQVAAFREAGWTMGRQFVMTVNNEYVRRGEIDADALINVTEVTDEIAARDNTAAQIDDAVAVLAGPCPPLEVTMAGDFYKWMEVMRFIYPKLPDDSLFNLCRLNLDQLVSFKAAGIKKLSDIPMDFEGLKPQQIKQLEAIKAGEPVIDAVGIKARLDALEFPLYFLDYETTNPAIPPFDGLKPYQQLPFQYSVHVLMSPTSKLFQLEYLAEGSDNPAPGLVEQLRKDIGDTGSVLVWYKGFEMSRNTELGELYPDAADFFANVNERVFDLMEIFSDGLYADERFHGSASIKQVLPVLVPELSYKTLGIQEGNSASRLWGQAARGELEPEVARKVYDDLRIYCGQDTLAMVRIYEFLIRAISES